jgi:hypothetical protein
MDIAKQRINCIFHSFDCTAFHPFLVIVSSLLKNIFHLGSNKFNNNCRGFYFLGICLLHVQVRKEKKIISATMAQWQIL